MTSMVDEPAPEPRILIAEGPWIMKENWLHHGSLGEDVLGYDVMVHKCHWKNNWFLKSHDIPLFMMLGEDPFCMNCNEKVPNMMKTLWTLKNMDKIQDGANYGKSLWGHPSFYFAMTPTDFYLLDSRPGQVLQYYPKSTKP